MRLLRWLTILLAALVGLLLVVSAAARFSDGPIAIFAGGPLVAGELARGPEPDWAPLADISTVELQLLEPPRSRTTWFVEHEGRLYIPCGYMDSTIGRLWKKWPVEAQRDGRALLRIEGRRYPRQLVRIMEPALFAVVAQKVGAKYGMPTGQATPQAGGLWIFELASPDAEVSGS